MCQNSKLIKNNKELSHNFYSNNNLFWVVILAFSTMLVMLSCKKVTPENTSVTNTQLSTTNNKVATDGKVNNLQPINLGKANDFTILTEAGISTTGVTSITGNIGSSPITSTAITGFGLIMSTDNQYATSTLVTGKIYGPDYAVPTPSYMTTAISDMENAFTTANGIILPAPSTEMYAGDISGQTLSSGLYKWNTDVLITNAGVTLTGGVNDVFVFQIAQNLIVNNNAMITLSGGVQAKNIFWIVSGQATLGTYTNFKGNILSKTLVSLNTGAVVKGKLFAQTAVTMIANSVTPQ